MDTVRVKPLDWREGPEGHHTDYAQSLLGEWATWEIQGRAYYRSPEMSAGKLAGETLEEAKTAAQFDYDNLIRSCLLPSDE